MPLSRLLVSGQCAVALTAIVLLALWPPQRGAMLLLPATGTMVPSINIALAAGAAVVRAGPVAGSVVVIGERRRIYEQARRSGVSLIAIAAPGSLCDDGQTREARA